MDKQSMKQIIAEYIKKQGRVLFPDIESVFENYGYEYKGIWAQCVAEDNPLVMEWCGWSEEAVDIIMELKKEGAFHYEPSSVVEYLATTGRILTFPVTKKVIRYKTEHWLPVALCY